MLPVLKAIAELGGSGSGREISATVVAQQGFPDELLELTYEGNEKSIVFDRLAWARSYNKLGGALESPKRGLFLLTDLGRDVLAMDDATAAAKLVELDRHVRRRNRTHQEAADATTADEPAGEGDEEGWKDLLLGRLHALTPDAFERFVLYLFRSQGMELERVGGSGDEGIDGIGTAPLTGVLTTTVAVQAKRYEPQRTVGRETVALFQADASAVGAERGILVTTGRFSGPAVKAARGRNPTIDLVDGEKLAELCLAEGVGIEHRPTVTPGFFDRFETD